MVMKTRIKSFITFPDKLEGEVNKWAEVNNKVIMCIASHLYLEKGKPTEYVIAYIVYHDD